MIRATLSAAVLAGLVGCGGRSTPAPSAAPPGLRVDGDFMEWAGRSVAAANGREVSGPDLREVRAAASPEELFLLLDFERPVNLQSMAGTLRLALDGDGDAATGERVAALEGADLVVDLSVMTAGAEAGMGMRLRLAGDSTSRSVYDAGLTYAPTHESRRFEVGIGRVVGGRPLLPGLTLHGLLIMLDATGAPVEVLGPFALDAPAARAVEAPEHTGGLERAAGTDVRVHVWNMSDDAAIERPEPFARILRAAAPDIVLMDELHPDFDDERLRALLPAGQPWNVLVGSGGGRQRTAVASRLELRPAPGMGRVEWPDSGRVLTGLPMTPQVRNDLATVAADGLPTMGAIATVGALRLLVVPIDLSCCGRAGSAEDRARVIAASAVNRAAREVLAAGAADAVLIGGDLNLVGSRLPLETLAATLDPDGGDLAAAELSTPDRRTLSTWRSPGPFPPGRLDWVLYTASILQQVGGMVLDADRLAPAVRAAAGLGAGDSEVTDHLPLVADFALRAGSQPGGR